MPVRTTYILNKESFENDLGTDQEIIKLIFEPDGGVTVFGVYDGPTAEEFWGDWDHEFWINIPSRQVKAFLALVAKDAFTRNGRLTFEALTSLCQAAEIEYSEGAWT